MQQYEDKPGYGTLWKPKNDHPSAPEFSGYMIAPIDYKAGDRIWVGAWVKHTRNNAQYMSCKIDTYHNLKAREGRVTSDAEVRANYAPVGNRRPGRPVDDEDVPF